jgi:hypothetical protein
MDAINVASSFTPGNVGEANAQQETMRQLTITHDARQQRIGVTAGAAPGLSGWCYSSEALASYASVGCSESGTNAFTC